MDFKLISIKSLSEITNVDQIRVLLNEKDLDVSTRQALLEKANNLRRTFSYHGFITFLSMISIFCLSFSVDSVCCNFSSS
ncbi:unnamed protein product [Caenorhabditis nigoni]